ncbi:MAG: hypothetical protein ACD_75C02143G0002, partial [uncultured bacterium]
MKYFFAALIVTITLCPIPGVIEAD